MKKILLTMAIAAMGLGACDDPRPAPLTIDNRLTDEEIEAKFGFLVEAYHYGAPPHGGLGIGLDRLAMVMLQAESLRDVVAFPKVQNASELMSACPAPVDAESLDVLGIQVTHSEDDE